MKFPKQVFVAGVLVGLTLGIMLGAALAEGKKEVNYTSIAGVGVMLVTIAGVLIARERTSKS
jgi:multidrug transporter EmrE-like cation transporter